MRVIPYLAFQDNCEEAMGFYRDCFGGEFREVNYFKDAPPEMGVAEALHDKIMHMALCFGDNVIMASDSFDEPVQPAGNVTLNISFDDVDELESVFQKLSKGGEITIPLSDAFWGARFAAFTDQYGVQWMVHCHTNNP